MGELFWLVALIVLCAYVAASLIVAFWWVFLLLFAGVVGFWLLAAWVYSWPDTPGR